MSQEMVTFITNVRYAKDMVNALNRMTFMFDTNWNMNNSDIATLPISFFGVKSMQEIMSSEVSTKQMLFFNDKAVQEGAQSQSSGLLNVVADNIVLKPKQYQLEIIVPYDNFYMPIGNPLFNTVQSSDVISMMAKGEMASNSFMHIAGQSIVTNLIKSIIKDLAFNTNFNTKLDTWVTNITETPMFNKHSLIAMRDNRSILKMKTWEGWRYKYVVITDLKLSKEPTEDGVFEGSMTVQEVPIMNVANYSGAGITSSFNNKFLETTGKLIKEVIDKQEERR